MIKRHKIKSTYHQLLPLNKLVDPDPINNTAFESAFSSPIHYDHLQVLIREHANPKNA